MTNIPSTGLQLISLLKSSGELEVSLTDAPVPEPKENEVLVRIEATPINPSDLGLLFGPADAGWQRSWRYRGQGWLIDRSSGADW